MLTEKQGEFLVKLARTSIRCFVTGTPCPPVPEGPEWLMKKTGVFTTMHCFPGNELRGCVGFPAPVFPLGAAVIESARSACCDDRFCRLSEAELGKVIVEVSVLSEPEDITFSSSEELLRKVSREKGLIIRKGACSALFLPQVWEQIWDKEEFLSCLCAKACLPTGAWKSCGLEVSGFAAQVFAEKTPGGKIHLVS